MADRRDAAGIQVLEDALFRCYVLAGADTDGAESLSDMGKLTPGIDVLAVRAVRELRKDYDEACVELWEKERAQ